MARVKLYFRVNRIWIPILSIPSDDFGQFTTRPLKWLRYLGYAIYGREGILKISPNGLELDDYTTDVANLEDRYYYVSPGKGGLIISGESLIFICRPTSIRRCIGCQRQNLGRSNTPSDITRRLQGCSHAT